MLKESIHNRRQFVLIKLALTQQVHDVNLAVLLRYLVKVFVKGKPIQVVVFEIHFCRLFCFLRPKQRHRSSDLNVGKDH